MGNLLAAIQRTPTASNVAVEETEPLSGSKPAAGETKATHRESSEPKGKPTQFWLFDEDRKMIRELAAWLSGQGIRTSDSMIVRSVLRTAKTGGALLEAYRQAADDLTKIRNQE